MSPAAHQPATQAYMMITVTISSLLWDKIHTKLLQSFNMRMLHIV